MVSIYRQVKYRSIIHITSQNEELFFKCLDKLLCKYNSVGFTIAVIHADNEFKLLMDNVKYELGVAINYTNPGDHIPEID